MDLFKKKPDDFIKLTPFLFEKCVEYMGLKGSLERTQRLYTSELVNIFRNEILTQNLYNKIYKKGNYYMAVLKLITTVCEHFDIPNYKYKKIKRKPTPKKPPQVWRESDILLMSERLEDYGLLISCAYFIGAGLRFSSAIMLKWDDFKWEQWVVDKSKVGKCEVLVKGGDKGILIVDPRLMRILYNFALDKGKVFLDIPYKNSASDLYLFINKIELNSLQDLFREENLRKMLDSEGNPINTEKMARVEMIRKKHYSVDNRLRKLSPLFNNRKVKFHSIRHSRATNLLRKGIKLLTIKKQLMHQSIANTEIYLNLVDLDMENEFNEKL